MQKLSDAMSEQHRLTLAHNFFTQLLIILAWLEWKKKDTAFEHYEDILLAETLREFFASVKTKRGENYSKSAMINLRVGLNRFLRLPPNNRIINLMQNDIFQNANQVFKGQLRRTKK